MVLGAPVVEVIAKYHDRYVRGEKLPHILLEAGIAFETFCSLGGPSIGDLDDGLYLMSVPSLNIQAGMHEVVLEVYDQGDVRIHDPNRGKEGKRYYTADTPDDELGVMIAGGYTIEARVWKHEEAK
jgi:hypothetical protein